MPLLDLLIITLAGFAVLMFSLAFHFWIDNKALLEEVKILKHQKKQAIEHWKRSLTGKL